ncbi:MAG: HNH endonuclease [Patescibacteria group bacterium]|nr:HNH endonuclease [Patescibacteria group bacterium]
MISPRLEAKIERIPESGCWLWTAALQSNGYGYTRDSSGMRLAHRAVYTALRGPIPAGLDLDHLCRVRCCVNPAHLEPVTRQVNLLRGTPGAWMKRVAASRNACAAGHEYTPENTRMRGKTRLCRICERAHGRRHDAKRRRPS